MTSSSRPELSFRAKRVLNGYVNLSAVERAAITQRIAEVNRGPGGEAMVVNEELQKGLRATLGPTSGACACCGR